MLGAGNGENVKNTATATSKAKAVKGNTLRYSARANMTA
jgi:hypothetical protein